MNIHLSLCWYIHATVSLPFIRGKGTVACQGMHISVLISWYGIMDSFKKLMNLLKIFNILEHERSHNPIEL